MTAATFVVAAFTLRPEKFWDRVDATGDCWEWTGRVNNRGYGTFTQNNRPRYAHRLAWEMLVGPIAPGLQIDHLCRNTRCVNPDHLEPVTNRENGLRGYGASGKNHRKTHCTNGHEFTPENTYLRPDGGARQCRECGLRRRRVPEDQKHKAPDSCPHGHLFTPETIRFSTGRGGHRQRYCQRCRNARAVVKYHRLKACSAAFDMETRDREGAT